MTSSCSMPRFRSRESRAGDSRACRGVGASLSPEEVAAFDREHAELLASMVPQSFTVLHRIDCHVMRPRRSEVQTG